MNTVMLRGKIISESISQSKEAGETAVEFSVSTHYDFRRAEDELVREKRAERWSPEIRMGTAILT